MNELTEDVQVNDGGYKVAFDDNWNYSIGDGSGNIAVTLPAGTKSFTVLCDEINQKVYDSVRTSAFNVPQNSGEIKKNALSTNISIIGTVRGSGDSDWDASKTGYEFTPITDKLYIYSKTFNKGKYEYKCVFDYANWYEAEAGNRSLDINADNTNVVFLYNTETGRLTDSINNANDVAATLGMQVAPAEAKVNVNANGSVEFVTVADGANAVYLVYGKKSEVEAKGDAALHKVVCKKLDNGGFSSGNIVIGDESADVVYYYEVDGTPVLDGTASETDTLGGVKYSIYKKSTFEGRLVNVPGTFPGPSWDAASNVMTYKGNGLYEATILVGSGYAGQLVVWATDTKQKESAHTKLVCYTVNTDAGLADKYYEWMVEENPPVAIMNVQGNGEAALTEKWYHKLDVAISATDIDSGVDAADWEIETPSTTVNVTTSAYGVNATKDAKITEYTFHHVIESGASNDYTPGEYYISAIVE